MNNCIFSIKILFRHKRVMSRPRPNQCLKTEKASWWRTVTSQRTTRKTPNSTLHPKKQIRVLGIPESLKESLALRYVEQTTSIKSQWNFGVSNIRQVIQPEFSSTYQWDLQVHGPIDPAGLNSLSENLTLVREIATLETISSVYFLKRSSFHHRKDEIIVSTQCQLAAVLV